jgi:hypothetical protein
MAGNSATASRFLDRPVNGLRSSTLNVQRSEVHGKFPFASCTCSQPTNRTDSARAAQGVGQDLCRGDFLGPFQAVFPLRSLAPSASFALQAGLGRAPGSARRGVWGLPARGGEKARRWGPGQGRRLTQRTPRTPRAAEDNDRVTGLALPRRTDDALLAGKVAQDPCLLPVLHQFHQIRCRATHR